MKNAKMVGLVKRLALVTGVLASLLGMVCVVTGSDVEETATPATTDKSPVADPASAASSAPPTAAGDQAADREKMAKLQKQGNYKEAYNGFLKLVENAQTDPELVAEDLSGAVQCLNHLRRIDEIDGLLEKAVTVHADNWRLLHRAALLYFEQSYHYGYIVGGEFKRGNQRGGQARVVNGYERDRVRALQLMQQAMAKIPQGAPGREVGGFYLNLTHMLMGSRGFEQSWRLQYLTDLGKLPDYEEGYYYGHRGSPRGAPVNEDGTPVYHKLAKNWAEAGTDGERWRWALLQVAEYDHDRQAEARHHFANFLQNQFGVQTLADYRWFFGRAVKEDEAKKDESGTWDLHTLGEDETVARLASGIKRFKMPDEFNYIKIYKELADQRSHGEQAIGGLIREFENRLQYSKAAEWWQRSIKEFGPGAEDSKQKQLNQIIGNWAQFERTPTQAAGQGATVDLRFRNGKKVSFEAYEIDVAKLLEDVKAYLKSNPKQLDNDLVNLDNIGWRLVTRNQKKYVGQKVAGWDVDLKPRPDHWDTMVTVTTPLQKAGAYLLKAVMADGNTSQVVVWVADTAIVRKLIENGSYHFVADAVTGQPVAKANLEFFGYRQDWVEDNAKKPRGGHYEVQTRDFAESADADGQLIAPHKVGVTGQADDNRYSWVVTATTPEGRLAYLGFSGIWYGAQHDSEYNENKFYLITDRPVYRPEQKVKFKVWASRAQYDLAGKSPFGRQKFFVEVKNPKDEKVLEKSFESDEYGGFDGELDLPKDATLGVYSVQLSDRNMAIGSFRVEEYKKPEFEVKVEAPKEPVMLGEKIEATIQAKYYFGAPVTEAKVKYKVLRSSYSADWYPIARWDWFFGKGYWWFASDYLWYPGWREWGCPRPRPIWWWQWHHQEPPEVVAEAEVPVGKDGTVKVAIDTAVAKAIYGDTDHRYEITAEVTDQSRRTITGQGAVLVARKPFKVYAWVDRGHYRVGEVVQASLNAHTLDGKPVTGKGELRLLKVSYKDGKPVESEVQKWALDTNVEGQAQQQIKAAEPGQFRLSYKLTDAKGHAIEGGYVFCIIGPGFDGQEFRFNDIELVTDKKEYQPGDKVDLLVNTNRGGSTVLLFLRPANGVYLPPKLLRLSGKSLREQVEVIKKDMPNFFIEAVTVSGGQVFSEVREVVVPPESRVVDVKVTPSAERYKPGEKATVKIKVTDATGEPFSGSTVVAIYDKSVEYISGGSNVAEIKEFFWKWRRHHQPATSSSLDKEGYNVVPEKVLTMRYIGAFGHLVATELSDDLAQVEQQVGSAGGGFGGGGRLRGAARAANKGEGGGFLSDRQYEMTGAPAAAEALGMDKLAAGERKDGNAAWKNLGPAGGDADQGTMVEPTVRSLFADTALWVAALEVKDGLAEVSLTMPENLTTWKTRVWTMGAGTRVGEGEAEVVTTKNLIVRLQAPRFFTQKDEVVLSANIHNFLKTKKSVKAVLELGSETLIPIPPVFRPGVDEGKRQDLEPILKPSSMTVTVEIEAGGEKRVDWLVQAVHPGTAIVRVKALSDEESDATEMSFPVYIHGLLKMESFCGVIRPEQESATVTVRVPAERLPEQSRLEVRYSPTLAGAMVDALPYMVDYPYGCTEQTLNRFLPTVVTQKVLLRMGLDLKDIQKKRTNLNAQQIGDDKARAKDWAYRGGYMSRATATVKEPVFDEAEVRDMVKAGLERLGSMQCSDGGWGWFSGWGERSWPHTTAVVVHGLQVARDNDVAVVPGMVQRGVAWLKQYQAKELQELKNFPSKTKPWKEFADDTDALVYMVLVDEKLDNKEMREFLYRDRTRLAVYTKAMFGLALHKVGDLEKRDMLIRNVEQFLVEDNENQTAYLKLPDGNSWWSWYGSEYEAQGYYLKLLALTDPKSAKASRLVKYLVNNRRHATYWNSTRDTAIVVEAFADYIKASGEDKPDLTLQVLVDGKQMKEVAINAANLFSFDNKLVLEGPQVATGEHRIELRKKGTGPVYFNAYLTNFTLEDPITRAGLEIKVNRKFYKLVAVDKTVKAAGSRGQAVDQKVEKYERQELPNLATLKSGELVEIEMVIESKNDYEYILIEDMKAAGFEPVQVRSGYNGNDLGAYMELRDERVTFFVRSLARGTHSVSYRMRAEIPGLFSALPTKASAMYAPELKANSDELKMKIVD